MSTRSVLVSLNSYTRRGAPGARAVAAGSRRLPQTRTSFEASRTLQTKATIDPSATSCSTHRGRLVLLDGVINEDVGSPGVLSVDTFTLIPGAAAAIARLKLAGASVCVVTNQTCVGKGLISEVELSDIHSRMRDLLLEQGGSAAVVDRIFVATRAADVPCHRRKPAPGMLVEAMDAFFRNRADSERLAMMTMVTMVGDSTTDMQAAAAAGITHRVMVATGHGAEILVALRAGGAGAMPLLISSPDDDPGDALPPETLPLVMYADIGEVVDAMLSDS